MRGARSRSNGSESSQDAHSNSRSVASGDADAPAQRRSRGTSRRALLAAALSTAGAGLLGLRIKRVSEAGALAQPPDLSPTAGSTPVPEMRTDGQGPNRIGSLSRTSRRGQGIGSSRK
jgi:hypothetical protein